MHILRPEFNLTVHAPANLIHTHIHVKEIFVGLIWDVVSRLADYWGIRFGNRRRSGTS